MIRTTDSPSVSRELALAMHRVMLLQRVAGELVQAGEAPPTILEARRGQEAIPAGIGPALRRAGDGQGPPDWLAGTIGQKQLLAMGAEPWRIYAEALGMQEGYGRGIGGSVPLASREHGVAGNHAVLGGSFGVGCGLALAALQQGTGQVALVGFGDGMSGAGRFHESLNLAATLRLPLVFFCVNNGYAETVASRATLASPDIHTRAAGYGIPAVQVDGNDPIAIYQALKPLVDRARAGEGPAFVEALTFSHWHLAREEHRYLTDEEIARWQARDPLATFARRLQAEFAVPPAALEALAGEVREELRHALARAKGGTPATPAQLRTSHLPPPRPVPGTMEPPGATLPGRPITYAEAISRTLERWMATDDRVFVIGCDVGRHGSLKGATRGLWARFGSGRVIDTAISEPAVAGTCVGAAMAGQKPVMELGVNAFSVVALDDVTSLAATQYYTSGGQYTVGAVFRTNALGSRQEPLTAAHARSLHAWYLQAPGLLVAMPSTGYDAAGLLQTALANDAPVLMVEHRDLYATLSDVPEEPYAIPFGVARVRRHGDDVTIVATGIMVDQALQAAEALAAAGISCAVIDPRTLVPLDEATILASVRRTRRLVTVDQSWLAGGFGSEVIARVVRAAPRLLLGCASVALPDAPNPQNRSLAAACYPGPEEIAAAVRRVLADPDITLETAP